MPTKKAKKVKKVKSSTDSSLFHEGNLKAILALFILLTAFGVFLLFNNYKDMIMQDGSILKFFLTLVVFLGGLLLALLFLINPQKRNK